MANRSLPLLDPVLGVIVLATIGVAATRSLLSTHTSARRLLFGWLLVVLPLPVVVASNLAEPSSALGGQVPFVCALVAFGTGAVLILSGRDDAEDGGADADLDPGPWWPEFERDFRAYASTHSRERVRR
jgi:hypothetical protein